MINYSSIVVALIFFSSNFSSPKFEEQVIDDTIDIGYGLAIGDVDGDGKEDILLADKKKFVWYRNGDWKRFVMIENLTESDNVCIAARDIDGDGKVEVAVGAQWNPSETSDTLKSGAVFFLERPMDPTQRWKPIKLHHEPTTHRMRWIEAAKNKYHLIVLPLHGRGNVGGEGQGVKIMAYEMPKDPNKKWKYSIIDESMHLSHNLDVVNAGNKELVYIGGKEGVKVFSFDNDKWTASPKWFVEGKSFGEVRVGEMKDKLRFVSGIEPMHGNELTVYTKLSSDLEPARLVIASDLNQGHALAVSDLLNSGMDQIVVGWREPNKENKVGIKIFVSDKESITSWKDFWIDDNGMACEDLKVADLNGDGKMDIIAAGRSTHNVKIYWNKSSQ